MGFHPPCDEEPDDEPEPCLLLLLPMGAASDGANDFLYTLRKSDWRTLTVIGLGLLGAGLTSSYLLRGGGDLCKIWLEELRRYVLF